MPWRSPIRRALPAVAAVAPQVQTFGQVVYQGNNVNTQIVGVTPDYEPVRNYTRRRAASSSTRPTSRPFARSRCSAPTWPAPVRRRGPGRPDDPHQQHQLPVIGVLTAKGGSGFGNQDDQVLVPITTAMTRLQRNRIGRAATSSRRSACRWSTPSRWTRPSSRSARCCASGTTSATRTTSPSAASKTCWSRPPDHGRPDPVPGRRGRHLAAGGRHRHHEHHAGVGHRAHA